MERKYAWERRDASAAINAAAKRKRADSAFGVFTKEVGNTHVGTLTWFSELEELARYVGVYLRVFHGECAMPAQWAPPPELAKLTSRAKGVQIEPILEGLGLKSEYVLWAGPAAELLTRRDGWPMDLRDAFLDERGDDPDSYGKLLRLPASLHEEFWEWVDEYIEC